MTEPTPPQQPSGAEQPAPQPPQQPAAPQAPVPPQDERTWSIVAHVGGIVTGFIAPLVVWLIYKDRSPRLDNQGKEALNFQLTLLIAHVIGWMTIWFAIGGLILFAAWAVAIIFGILGAVAASRDEWYKYPFKITFIK